jgi:hypothetical protein
MEKLTEQSLKALLAREGLEAKEGDLESFGHLIDTYIAALKALHSIDLGNEEIAPTFHPEGRLK